MNTKGLTAITYSGETLDRSSFSGLSRAENLVTITVAAATTADWRLDYLYLSVCQNLTTITLANTPGIQIDEKYNVPSYWSKLQRLSAVNFQNCNLSVAQVDQLIKSFSDRVDNGLGQGVITAKTLTINGANARPTLTDATVAAAKSNLIAKGWTVNHNV